MRILGRLLKRADKIDAIIVETTGFADPAPVTQTFFVYQDVSDCTRLVFVTGHIERDTLERYFETWIGVEQAF
tara:strand:+ start:498 stop:716 length:219 start_codon:yes stop_codon:yes gene_type:complete